MKFLKPILLLLILTLLNACKEEPSQPKASAETWFPITVGTQEVQMQLAITTGEMTKGLMYRTSLPQNSGMLFVYDKPSQLRFWMMHTEIPLDIGYFDTNGILLEIYPMEPRNLNEVPSTSDNIQFALEMEQGWYQKNGVKVGDKLDLAAVRANCSKRGFER